MIRRKSKWRTNDTRDKMDSFPTMTAYYICDSLNITLGLRAVSLFTNSPQHAPDHSRQDWCNDQLWSDRAASNLSTQLIGVEEGLKVGAVLHLAVSSSKASSSPDPSGFHPPLFPELLQVEAGVIKVSPDLTLECLPCHNPPLKKKTSSSVNKSIRKRQPAT